MSAIVCIINGYPRSGKDTFCEFVASQYKAITWSTVDTPKKVLKTLGWDGNKTPEVRKALSDLKDMYTKLFDGPFNEAKYFIKNNLHNYAFCFIMCREPNEISKIKKWCKTNNIDCYTIFVERDNIDKNNLTNHADKNVSKYTYDIYISNISTLEDFKRTSLKIANILRS